MIARCLHCTQRVDTGTYVLVYYNFICFTATLCDEQVESYDCL